MLSYVVCSFSCEKHQGLLGQGYVRWNHSLSSQFLLPSCSVLEPSWVCSQRTSTLIPKTVSAARFWHCRNPGLNRGPLDLQSNALPTELFRPTKTLGETSRFVCGITCHNEAFLLLLLKYFCSSVVALAKNLTACHTTHVYSDFKLHMVHLRPVNKK